MCLSPIVVNLHTEPTMNAKPTALDAKIKQLQQLADDQFDHDPDAIHWGRVRDLGRLEDGLDELLAIFSNDE